MRESVIQRLCVSYAGPFHCCRDGPQTKPTLEKGLRMQVSGSLGTNLQVSCFCTTRRDSLRLASLVARLVKNPPVMWETWVRSMGWEDPLDREKGYPLQDSWASLVAQLVKNLPAMQET